MYTFQEVDAAYTPSFSLPFPQTKLYAHIQQTQGLTTKRFTISKDTAIIGYFQIIIYPLIANKTSIYIPYGPVLTETSEDLVSELSKFLKIIGQKERAVFIRTDFSGITPTLFPKQYKELPGFAYKTAFHQPRGEWLLDITPAADELLAQMHKKTRYNINKSLKQNLETTFFVGKNIEPWADTFVALNDQNTKDHGTTTHPKEYFKSFFTLASESSDNFIAITRKEGHVLAINIFIRTGNSVFCPFGASNDLGKKLGAYYHIKWSSIKYMKDHGVRIFNWGGVSVGMHDEYLQGVTKFKTGFGGEQQVHPPLHDIIILPLWYAVYMFRKFLKQ